MNGSFRGAAVTMYTREGRSRTPQARPIVPARFGRRASGGSPRSVLHAARRRGACDSAELTGQRDDSIELRNELVLLLQPRDSPDDRGDRKALGRTAVGTMTERRHRDIVMQRAISPARWVVRGADVFAVGYRQHRCDVYAAAPRIRGCRPRTGWGVTPRATSASVDRVGLLRLRIVRVGRRLAKAARARETSKRGKEVGHCRDVQQHDVAGDARDRIYEIAPPVRDVVERDSARGRFARSSLPTARSTRARACSSASNVGVVMRSGCTNASDPSRRSKSAINSSIGASRPIQHANASRWPSRRRQLEHFELSVGTELVELRGDSPVERAEVALDLLRAEQIMRERSSFGEQRRRKLAREHAVVGDAFARVAFGQRVEVA